MDGGRRTKGFRPGRLTELRYATEFVESRREPGFLLPPDVRDWLLADHVAWFVIDAVADMDLAALLCGVSG